METYCSKKEGVSGQSEVDINMESDQNLNQNIAETPMIYN